MRKPRPLPPDATPLAQEVYKRMAGLGIGQKSLALRAGLNETYVRDLFSGHTRNPKSAHLEKLARALGCEVADLSTTSSDEPAHVASNDKQKVDQVDFTGILPLFESEVSLVRLWRVLPDPARDRILNTMIELLPQAPRKR
jgi:transcriptional regulator with XRE-family HTH domain